MLQTATVKKKKNFCKVFAESRSGQQLLKQTKGCSYFLGLLFQMPPNANNMQLPPYSRIPPKTLLVL